MRTQTYRRWGTAASAVLLACTVTFAGQLPAFAASGGGCHTDSFRTRQGVRAYTACISAPGVGVAAPDAYITLLPGHPGCTISISLVHDRSVPYRITGPRTVACIPGGTQHVVGYPKSRLRGNGYVTEVVVTGAGTSTSHYSPPLALP